ncbi:uncharacterized protein [Dermacentor andersoni]|uniref:uncharacterized protein n=1 Tax=Dermacentor andersoni TaxID=34620 RepID=UPI0024170B63|nr:uncharacterized protein LOC129383885 [Dermacentor andersoni]
MPGYAYRLCGFASGVDGRPVNFKEPLSHARVCGLCGFVSVELAVLPCLHFLCTSCLGGCAQGDGGARCPMDKTSFQVDEVAISPFHCADLAEQLVSCWNASNGCGFEGPVDELLEHFEKHCTFHATTCPRCRETVTRGNLPRHYVAGCDVASKLRIDGGGNPAVTAQTDELLSRKAGHCSYHDLLTSMQSQMNDLAEALAGISTAIAEWDCRELELLPGATTGRGAGQGADVDSILAAFTKTSAALTEHFDSMNRSLPQEVASALVRALGGETLDGSASRVAVREQQECGYSSTIGGTVPSVDVGALLAALSEKITQRLDNLSHALSREGTVPRWPAVAAKSVQTCPDERALSPAVFGASDSPNKALVLLVLIMNEKWCKVDGYYNGVRGFPVIIGNMPTGLSVSFYVSREANLIALFARLDKKGGNMHNKSDTNLPVVRRLSSSELESPAIKMRYMRQTEAIWGAGDFSSDDKFLLFVCNLKEPGEEDYKARLELVMEFN